MASKSRSEDLFKTTEEMKELLEYTYVKKETWDVYLTDLYRKKQEEMIPDTPKILTNELTIVMWKSPKIL